jgi:glycosyltransferase involved in cell wall biosynthesis
MFGGHTPLHYPQARSFHAKLHNALYTGPLYRWLARGVSRFQALNTHEYGLYRRLFPGHQVYKIYNPFDADVYRTTAPTQAPGPAFDPKRLHILWVGRLTEQKGVAALCQLVDSLPAANQAGLCGTS